MSTSVDFTCLIEVLLILKKNEGTVFSISPTYLEDVLHKKYFIEKDQITVFLQLLWKSM